MKIEELSELADIKIESLKELVKNKNSVYAIGVDIKDTPIEIAKSLLHDVKNKCSELGLTVIVYGMYGDNPKLKFYKLDK